MYIIYVYTVYSHGTVHVGTCTYAWYVGNEL